MTFFHVLESCPRCGTVLDEDNWCEECGEQITEGEIQAHEAMFGGIWDL